MTRISNSRMQAHIIQADSDALVALKTITGYQPANPAYSLPELISKYDAMRVAQETLLNTQNAVAAARDALVAAQWTFHDVVLGAKDQIIAQYGPDSDHVAALGLKKKSERRTPKRAAKVAAQ